MYNSSQNENSYDCADFSMYSLEDNTLCELRNNLVIVNAIVNKKHLNYKPEFYVLGGAAFVFYGLTDRATLDIDTLNCIDDNIKDEVNMFISDQASDVVKLNGNFTSRLVPYMEELSAIKVYLVSQEDLIITKLYSGRKKDIHDLLHTNILNDNNFKSVSAILETEYPKSISDRFIKYLNKLRVKKENSKVNEE